MLPVAWMYRLQVCWHLLPLLSLLDIAADIWDNCRGIVMVITKSQCRLDGICCFICSNFCGWLCIPSEIGSPIAIVHYKRVISYAATDFCDSVYKSIASLYEWFYFGLGCCACHERCLSIWFSCKYFVITVFSSILGAFQLHVNSPRLEWIELK
jgi:hypothetical protein